MLSRLTTTLKALPLTTACAALWAPLAAAEDATPCGLYAYRAEITRVVDGDTVIADIDLGFRMWLRGERLRLARIDAPETRDAGGEEATQALRDRVGGRRLLICTIKAARSDDEQRGRYGRYLVEIYDGEENVNDWMMREGFAVEYGG